MVFILTTSLAKKRQVIAASSNKLGYKQQIATTKKNHQTL